MDSNELMQEDLTEEVVQEAPQISTEDENRKQRLKQQLEKDVRLNVFLIGVGNAGNQTIVHAHHEGMNVFAVNSSMRDLSDAIVDESIPSFIIGNEARGSGKNIEKGRALFNENGRDLFESKQFIDSCQDADIIVVISATGGGTGPSVAPELLRVLKMMFDKKIIMYHGITPKNSDSNIAFSNTTYCLNEIKNLDIPYMLTDLETFANEPNDEAFVKADKHVVQCCKVVAGHYLKMSNSQMIDENDLKSIIGEPGYMGVYCIDAITSADLEKKTMQEMMIDRIKTSPSVMIQKDGISMQMGSIVNCPDDMVETTRSGNYDELFKFIGHKPKNGIYANDAVIESTSARFILILSGMTYPINRLSYYVDVVKEQDEFLKKHKTIDTSQDAELVQKMVSNSTDKLSSETQASNDQMKSALDMYFKK